MSNEKEGADTGNAPVPVQADWKRDDLRGIVFPAPSAAAADAVLVNEERNSDQHVARFAADLHAYLQQNIGWAEAKSGFLLAACGALLAFLHNQGVTKKIMPALFDIPNTLSNTVGAIAVSALVVAACAAFATFWPRTRGDVRGIVFWKAVANSFQTSQAFADNVLARTPRALTESQLQHCWELARVCQRKFRWVYVATYAAALGFLSALIYLAVWFRRSA